MKASSENFLIGAIYVFLDRQINCQIQYIASRNAREISEFSHGSQSEIR